MDDYLEEMIRLISDYASKRKVIDQNFFERLADIESYKEILEMAKCLCLKKAYLYNEYALYSVYLKAYVKEYVPTLAFLRYMGYSDSIEEIKSLTGEMKQKDRLLLGLNISEKKFKNLVRKQEDAWHHFNE